MRHENVEQLEEPQRTMWRQNQSLGSRRKRLSERKPEVPVPKEAKLSSK